MKRLLFLLIFSLSLHQHAWPLHKVASSGFRKYQRSYSNFPSTKVSRKARIAVIGAGFAGLHLTNLLKQNDYQVTTFEKNSASTKLKKRHGKAFTLDLGKNNVVEMGAIQVGFFHDFTHYYQKELNVESFEPQDPYVLSPGPSYGTHKVLKPQDLYFPSGQRLSIVSEVFQLEKILGGHLWRYPRMEDTPDNSELSADLASFMTHHQLPHLHEIFKIFTSAYGYDQTEVIKAFKAFHMLSSGASLLFSLYFNQNPKMLRGGFGGFADALVERYKLDENIKYDQSIKAIHRSSEGVIIEHFNGDKEHFDKVIFACPIDKIFYTLDATDQEKALYENLHYSPYATFAVKMANFKRGGCIFHHNLNRNCHVQMASNNSPTDEVVIFYMPLLSSTKAGKLGSLMHTLPHPKQLRIMLEGELKALGFEVEEVLAHKIWHDYNPHFQKPSFYKLGQNIQGDNHTYFAGTMLGTSDNVNEAFKQAHRLLQEHFEGEFYEPDHSSISRLEWHFDDKR